MTELEVDPKRQHLHGMSGLFCRAKTPDGRWGSYNVLELTDESFEAFVRSRATEDNDGLTWAVGVAQALAHDLQDIGNALPGMPEDYE